MSVAPAVLRVRAVPAARALAGVAVMLLAYQTYTLSGWVGDSPHQITSGRIHSGTSWWAARAIEFLVLASVAGFVVHAARERRREGRIGIDGLLIIGMFSAAFWDPIYNWTDPAWLYSANWLNVNAWLDGAPGFAGHVNGQPWPIVIVLVGYPLWGVGFAMVVNLVMSRAGNSILLGLATAIALTCGSFATFKAFDLMDAPGFRFSVLGNSDVLFAGLSGGIVFWGLALLREHGERLWSATSTATRVLAAMAACQLIVVLGWGVLTVPFTSHASPYPGDIPAHLTQGVAP